MAPETMDDNGGNEKRIGVLRPGVKPLDDTSEISYAVSIPQGNGYTAETLHRVTDHIAQLGVEASWAIDEGGKPKQRMIMGDFALKVKGGEQAQLKAQMALAHAGLLFYENLASEMRRLSNNN